MAVVLPYKRMIPHLIFECVHNLANSIHSPAKENRILIYARYF